MTVNLLSVEDLIAKLENKNLTIDEIVKIFYKKINQKNSELNAIISKIPYRNLKRQIALSEKRNFVNSHYFVSVWLIVLT